MSHPESEHSLMIEVARLQQDLREARAQIGKERDAWVAANARADAAEAERLVQSAEVSRLEKAHDAAQEALAAARRECDFMRRALMTIVSMVRGHPEYFAGEIFSCASEALGAPGAAAGEDSK